MKVHRCQPRSGSCCETSFQCYSRTALIVNCCRTPAQAPTRGDAIHYFSEGGLQNGCTAGTDAVAGQQWAWVQEKERLLLYQVGDTSSRYCELRDSSAERDSAQWNFTNLVTIIQERDRSLGVAAVVRNTSVGKNVLLYWTLGPFACAEATLATATAMGTGDPDGLWVGLGCWEQPRRLDRSRAPP